MAVINDQDRAAITKLFDENLVDPVRMVYFTVPPSPLIVPGRQNCETCNDVQSLVEEIADTSDKLSVEIHHFERERDVARQYGVDRVPALVLASEDESRVRFFGAPAGYEFSTLIQDIQFISKGETNLSQATRDVLSGTTEPISLKVFVTPT